MNITSLVFLLACVGIAYGGFCRLAHLDLTARASIRVSVYLVTVASIWAAAAVVLWSYRPGWPAAAIASSTMLLMAATSRAWRDGVPAAFRKHS